MAMSQYSSSLSICGPKSSISMTGMAMPTLLGSLDLFSTRRYDAYVRGLCGCTSVVALSQAGMWVSHFWEIPSFRATRETWGQPRTAPDITNFIDHVINQMQNGGPDIIGLRQFTAAGGQFDTPQRPVWAIITPQGSTPNSWRYEPEVNQI